MANGRVGLSDAELYLWRGGEWGDQGVGGGIPDERAGGHLWVRLFLSGIFWGSRGEGHRCRDGGDEWFADSFRRKPEQLCHNRSAADQLHGASFVPVRPEIGHAFPAS